jgi:hypothetical protein
MGGARRDRESDGSADAAGDELVFYRRGAERMTQLTHMQYEMLERAVVNGTRIVVTRSGGRESVLIPLSLGIRDGREAIETRNPTTGHEMRIYLDEVDAIEVVK